MPIAHIYDKPNNRLLAIGAGGTSLTTVSPRNLGEVVYSPLPLTDASLHLADGTLIDSTGVYASAVTDLAALKSAMPDAPCWATEEAWQAEFAAYGACAKWVVNTEAGTVRIPNLTGFVEGTVSKDELGRLVEAGLPDHSHYAAGALKSGGVIFFGGTGGAMGGGVDTDNASDHNPIYGNSDTVQPQSLRVYVYVCLLPGLSTAAADIKQDVANVVRAVEERTPLWAAHAAMPSSQYIDLELPASGGAVTAPADGWIHFNKGSGAANEYADIVNGIGGVNGVGGLPPTGVMLQCPVSKGEVITINYTLTGVTHSFRFIYCNGSAPTE